VDMRHPSTPGDRGTVRAALRPGQIAIRAARGPCAVLWKAWSEPRVRRSWSQPADDANLPVDSVLPPGSDGGYVRGSSSFPAFRSDPPPTAATRQFRLARNGPWPAVIRFTPVRS